MSKTISIIGAGWVGLTSAAIFANCDYKVYIIDVNKDKIDTLKNKKSPFYEYGLEALIEQGVTAGKLIPTTEYKEAIENSQVVFSCVGTPEKKDGSFDMSQIMSAANSALKYLDDDTVFVQKSTVPVGTGEIIQNIFNSNNRQISYIANPEFLRESSAVQDTLFFDRVVVGGADQKAIDDVIEIYKHVENNRVELAKLVNINTVETKASRYIENSIVSAELIKISANSFLATKISFANSIALLAEKSGADINEVLDAVGADTRIGNSFLKAGRGYGGGCFPKDVSGLLSVADNYGVDLGIIREAAKLNDLMPDVYIDKVKTIIGGNLNGVKVAVLGLSFKENTNDTRKSPGIKIANKLVETGAIVSAYDPQATIDELAEINQKVKVCSSIKEAINGSSAIFIATKWKEFIDYSLEDYASLMSVGSKLFVDCINAFSPEIVDQSQLVHVGIGRAKKNSCGENSEITEKVEVN